MTSGDHDPVPTEIQLHRKSRVLEVGFDDGARFRLPVEYLRVFSPAAEARTAFFAQIATDVGREVEEVVLPSTVRDVRDLLRWLSERGGAWQRTLSAPTLTVAINKQFAEPSSILKDGDEIALVTA